VVVIASTDSGSDTNGFTNNADALIEFVTIAFTASGCTAVAEAVAAEAG
jgi:hypothetical protein